MKIEFTVEEFASVVAMVATGKTGWDNPDAKMAVAKCKYILALHPQECDIWIEGVQVI